MQKIKYRHVLDTLRNIKQEDNIKHNTISKILGGTPTANALAGRYHSDGYMEAEEIEKIQNKYNYDFYSNSFISVNNEGETVTLDYYPDVFGSCGTGYFVSSEEKEQIQVPVNALFKQLSAGKKYSVINAQGTSMQPYIEPEDKLIIEHLDNQPIIDNHVYVFCYDKDLYIKRLYKNIDEIIAKSDNPDPIFKVKSIPKEEWCNLQVIGEVVGLMRSIR